MELLNTIANNRYWNKHGIALMWALAALVLAVAIIRVGWISYNQAMIRTENYAPKEVIQLAQPEEKTYHVDEIVAANLFGDTTPAPVVTQAPKTTLNLTLNGILSASDPAIARAIISSGSNDTQLYSVGENIRGAGASIKEILVSEVLLNRNGATERLLLLKSDESGNRPIISYGSSQTSRARTFESSRDTLIQPANRINQEQFSAANRSSNKRAKGTSGKPRKIRKPNFSGLDRALKKMGDL